MLFGEPSCRHRKVIRLKNVLSYRIKFYKNLKNFLPAEHKFQKLSSGDYRQLNKMTIKDKYPIPNVQTLFYRLAGAKVFSKVDLVKAYHQIPIDLKSIPFTAIITPFGLFEYLYMSFGLRNANATFQRYMIKSCKV